MYGSANYRLHPDKHRAIQQLIERQSKTKRAKPAAPQASLMQNLAARSYAVQQAQRRRRVI